MLAKNKLNSIETLMSQALIDLDISHEEFKTIVNGKEKYEQMKENIRNTKIVEILEEIMKIQRFKKKKIFFFFMYIMVVITIENCTNAKVHTIKVENRELFWIKND